VGSQLIPSNFVQVAESDLRAVPTNNACFFNTSTNFSCVKMGGPASAHYFIAPHPHTGVSLVSTDISVRGKLPCFSNVSDPENRRFRIYQNLERTARFWIRTGGYLTNSNSPPTKVEIIRNRLQNLVASTRIIYEVDAHISHPWSHAQPTHIVQGRATKDSICGWYTSKISTLCLSRWIQHLCTATQFSST